MTTSAAPTTAERGRRRTLLRMGSRLALLAGSVLLAAGPLDEAQATYAQHELAVRSDASLQRYGQAMRAAYDVLAADAQVALETFESGALPTAVDGAVITVPSAAQVRPEPSTDAQPAPDAVPIPRAPTGHVGAFTGGVIRIPAIGLDQSVVEGVSRDHLRLGPGHYPGTARPGEQGNVVISGHRTTYTSPFHDLDLLQPGDEVLVDTPTGTHRYVVADTLVVAPEDGEVLRDTTDARLTLTTCHPKGSASSRLVVVAHLD